MGGRLQGLKHKKLFYTIGEMSLRSSIAEYGSGKIRLNPLFSGVSVSGGYLTIDIHASSKLTGQRIGLRIVTPFY